MSPEQWHRVKEVFEAALEHAPSERSAFLAQVCAGDDSMHGEVKSLLSSYEQEQSFLDTPAAALAAQSLIKEESAALVGQQLGHYQIVRELGRGGMGVVYLAQDTILGRPVALKLLPAHLTSDPDRLRRFEREARAASALNHPNILTIHEIAEMDGLHFIATEFIDGVMLREKIKGKGLELSDALDIAEQIGSALAAAHDAGIVHRDIKPENVMLRRDGYVKVLDFGLAKLAEMQTADVSAALGAMAATAGTNTITGVAGTAGYMSPEQARGESVDHRTDIFSLGVVLYEMLTGRMPFEIKTPGGIRVPMFEHEPPPLTDFLPKAPAKLQLLVSKALRQHRDERHQAVNELLTDLRAVRSEHSARSRFTAKQVGLLAAAVALVIVVPLWFYASRNTIKPVSEAPLSSGRTVPFTGLSGQAWEPAFSPDGSQVAFTWNGDAGDTSKGDAGDKRDIYVKLVDGGTPQRLTTNTDWELSPVWSPDGHYIAFTRTSNKERSIIEIPTIGGSERRLHTATSALFPGWGGRIDWSPNGKLIAYADTTGQGLFAIFLLAVDTQQTRQLTSPPEHWPGDTQPVFSPDGHTLAFVRLSSNIGDLYVMPVAGGEPRRLTFDNDTILGLAWTTDGRSIVFASDRAGTSNLWRIAPTGGEAERLGVGGDGVMTPAISRQGQLAYTNSFSSTSTWRVNVTDSPGKISSPTRVLSASAEDEFPQISPDGRRIAFGSNRTGAREIWVCSSDGSNLLQLTNLHRPAAGMPSWSPDGRFIVFDTRLGEQADVYVIGADGGPPSRLTDDPAEDDNPRWSRDGRWVYFHSNRSGEDQIWKIPAEGGEAVQVTKQGGMRGVIAFESPDGRYVYYTNDARPADVRRMPVEGGKEEVVLRGVHPFHWGVSHNGIYFAEDEGKGGVVKFFSFATRKVTRITTMERPPAWDGGMAVSPDGRWLLYTQVDIATEHIMLVENFR